MILTKKQIKLIKQLHDKAIKAEIKARIAESELCDAIVEVTGINGAVDYLTGDGHGFTPESNNDTHISIDLIITSAEKGIDITEEFILDNLSF